MNLSADILQELIETALAYRQNAYTPYSGFAVGAALLTEDRRIFGGCNVENAAFSPTLCAERTAFAKAVSEGCRSFAALAVVGGPATEDAPLSQFCPPCGVCRQWLAEFCDPEMPVILAKSVTDYKLLSCGELLPEAFSYPTKEDRA